MTESPPTPPNPRHWFQPVAEFLGPAYLRNAFTKGTEQEVAFLWDALGLRQGDRLLDVGCGPGRHSLAFARRGVEVVGVDLSEEFVSLARQAAEEEGLPCRFEVGDARRLAFDGEFDAAVSLCQGGFGLPDPPGAAIHDDLAVVDGIVGSLRPGGRLALSAFSAYFAVRFLEVGDDFDADTGVNHEVATVRGPGGDEAPFDLWTSCWTPRELRLVAERAGLVDVAVSGVAPGAYGTEAPRLDLPEFLLLATRQGH